MAIEFTCPHCDSTIRVPDAASGKKGTCPACHSKLKVPVVNIPDVNPAASPAAASRPASPAKKSARSVPEPSAEKPASTKRSSKSQRQEAAPFDPFLDALSNPIHDESETNTALLDALEGPTRKSKSTPKTKKQAPEAAPSKTKPAAAPASNPHWVDDANTVNFATEDDSDEATLPTHFDAAEPAEDQPPPPPVTRSVAKKIQKQGRGTGNLIGIIFFVICGFGLVGGVAWYTLRNDTTYGGDRVAYIVERGTALGPKAPDPSLVDVSEESKKVVFKTFKHKPPRIGTGLVDMEFGVTGDEFSITIREGTTSQFYRFPIDRHLMEFKKKHSKELEQRRLAKLKPALKSFFSKWDVGIRNGDHPKDFSFRDDVGLCTCVGSLGYALTANVNGTLYPCVFEDDEAKSLYFLLPRGTKFFEVSGRYGLEGNKPSIFPGTYRVAVKGLSKDKSGTKTKTDDDADTKPTGEMMEAPTDGEGEGMSASGMSAK